MDQLQIQCMYALSLWNLPSSDPGIMNYFIDTSLKMRSNQLQVCYLVLNLHYKKNLLLDFLN